jgi:DNA-binding transcriptional LysR family regulator
MSTFLARYPAVVGELALTDRIVNLVEDGVDAAIRIGILEDSSLVARKVGETRQVVVAAPKYLAKRKALRSPADLGAHDVIQLTALAPTPTWHLVRDGKDEQVSFTPHFVTNSADAAIGHAERGGGVTMVLAYQVAKLVQAGKLEVLLAKLEPPPLPIHIVYPTSRLLSANVRTFIDLVTTTCDWRFVTF